MPILPETLECLVLGFLSNLPKGLLGLNDPLLPNLLHLSLLLKLAKCPFCPLQPLSKFPLNFLLGLVKNGLKGFYWFTFKVHLIQGFSKVVAFFFQGRVFCVLEWSPDRSSQKSEWSSNTWGGGGGGCGSSGLWLLSIVFEHSTKKREVIMTIKNAIQFCWHGGLEQIDHSIVTMAQLFGCFFDISDDSSMSSLAGSKQKVLHLSCKCLIL